MARSVYVCGDSEIYTPECDDCSEVKARVTTLEACCESVRTTINDHETRITNNTNGVSTNRSNIATNTTNIATNTSDISQIRSDLANYYTKSQTYTKQEVLDLIGQIEGVSIQAVNELPQTGEPNIIYLVPKQGETGDVKDEYIWVNNAWEKIGSTDIDLSNYATKTYVNDGLAGKQDTLTAGDNITINNNRISATDTTYTAGENITITNNEISAQVPTGDFVEQSVFNEDMQAIADVDNDQCSRIGELEALGEELVIMVADKQDKLTAGDNVTISNNVISATDTTYSEATDTDLGLVKTNSANGITLDANGALKVAGVWGEKNNFVYYGKNSTPSETGDAGNGVLVTEANGLQIGNKMLAVITGSGSNTKGSSPAGTTQYQFADNYTNRIILSGYKGGFAALNESAAKTKTVKVLSVLRDGQEVVPSSIPADSTKNIVVTVAESANPDSAASQIRFYGTSGGFSNLVVGQGVSCGVNNSNSIVGGQVTRNFANLSIVAGAQNYNAGSRSAIFGTLNINPVSANQNVFLAGQGHDTTNGSANVAAVGQYSEINANTAFAVGNGVGVYDGTGDRSNAMEVTKDGGIILKSPNGTKYKITVANNGTLTTTAV